MSKCGQKGLLVSFILFNLKTVKWDISKPIVNQLSLKPNIDNR
jgi:hypothetical protein